MSRKPHPYFGYINRLEGVYKPPSGRRSVYEPTFKPENEPGILWDVFRDPQTPE